MALTKVSGDIIQDNVVIAGILTAAVISTPTLNVDIIQNNVVIAGILTAAAISTPTLNVGILTASVISTPTLNVGIGSTSSFTADISGDIRIQSTNKLRFGGTSTSSNFYIQYNSTANSLDFVAG